MGCNLTCVTTGDGTLSAFSEEFNEHYHSTKDGALHEALYKHVLPSYKYNQHKKQLHILDICFGLGINTLATLYYYQKFAPEIEIFIYSPEFDTALLNSLEHFSYPKELQPYSNILKTVILTGCYNSKKIHIELFVGDAREYLKKFNATFDIIYQDAFSPKNNPLLWTKEYFAQLSQAIKDDGTITTYSTALQTRLALHQNNFFIYLLSDEHVRDFTIASKIALNNLEKIDMEHKIACNKEVKPLSDTQFKL